MVKSQESAQNARNLFPQAVILRVQIGGKKGCPNEIGQPCDDVCID